jgi:hypothetical protein
VKTNAEIKGAAVHRTQEAIIALSVAIRQLADPEARTRAKFEPFALYFIISSKANIIKVHAEA